jgi:hypothetical protein
LVAAIQLGGLTKVKRLNFETCRIVRHLFRPGKYFATSEAVP